jgi:tetratricopeptide (TPR) repeat protein
MAQAPQADDDLVSSDPLTLIELREAVELQGAQRTGEAMEVLQRILAREPGNPDALHLMGMARFFEGRHDEGLAMVQQAVAGAPEFGAAVSNLGTMLRMMNRAAEALPLLRRRTQEQPQDPQAHRTLGNTLMAQGDLAGAAEQLGIALQLNPDDALAHAGLAVVRLRQQRYHEAEANLRHALGLRPAEAEFHMNLGVALRMLNKLDEAIGSLRVALLLRPSYPEARINLGLTLLERGRADEAEENLRAALAESPQSGEAHMVLGFIALQRGDEAAGIASLRQAVEVLADPAPAYALLAPRLAGAEWAGELVALERLMAARTPGSARPRLRLARALARTGLLDEAVVACERALAIDPAFVEAIDVLAAIRYVQGRTDEARARYHSVLALSPGHAGARMALAMMQLAEGNFADGLAGLEARLETAELAAFNPVGARLPALDQGVALAGRRVLLAAEQGQGDTLQFVRYARLLAERGAQVLIEAQAPLVPLLRGMPGVAEVTAQGAAVPAADLVCPMMSLPLVFGTRVDTIPAQVPYLAAPEDRRQAWAARLGPGTPGRRRVALCWAGNPDYSADMFRSVPLALLAPVLAAEGVEVHLVQTGIRAGDDAVVAAHPGVVDLRRELQDFADTAAVLERMDLVISVDTAVAHLAGALARPLWLLLPHAADWRWMEERTDSPWYPTARLFRQPGMGDWAPVVEAVRAALRGG